MADPTGMVAAAAVAAGGKPKKSASDILTVARAAYYRVKECAEEAADKAAKALAMAADITGAV